MKLDLQTARRNLNSLTLKQESVLLKIIKQHKERNNCFNLTILYV